MLINIPDLNNLTEKELRVLCEKLLQERCDLVQERVVIERQKLKSKRRTIDVFGKMVDVKKAQKIIEYQNTELEDKNIEIKRQKEAVERTFIKFRQRTIELFGKMTDLKKANKIIQQQNDEIESQRKLLHEINLSKDKFFSIVAHDLKNPIGGFLGLTEILATENHELSSEDQQFFIKSLNESSKHLYSLLENLLHWARSQTGSLHLKPKVFEFEELLESAIEHVSMNAQLKSITIRIQNESSIKILTDEDTMKTILRNLLSNAIKFSNPGSFIDIMASQQGKFANISITDYGIGISEQEISKLFKIEYSNSKLGTSQEKGTGLGLILCKEFIELNGGIINVKSIVGKETTFTISVPIFV